MRLFLPRTVLDRIAPADIEQRPDALHVDGEGDGQAFTERAAAMLCAVFRAAKREELPCLPYARELIRLGLRGAGERLDRVDPLLCRLLLADAFEDADWESRSLTGSWQ